MTEELRMNGRVDPVVFAAQAIGISMVLAQRDVLQAAVESPMLAVVSGHKTGMSTAAAVLSAWFYCEREPSRVVIADGGALVLMNYLLNMVPKRAPQSRFIYTDCSIPESFHWLSTSPSVGGRSVYGDTLVVVDGAHQMPDETLLAVDAVARGSKVRVVLLGHGSTASNAFTEIVSGQRPGWRTMRFSSEGSPNVVSGTRAVPGLATAEWVHERKQEWGADSPLYRSRVMGELQKIPPNL